MHITHSPASTFHSRMKFIIAIAEKIMPLAAWRYAIVGASSTTLDFTVFLLLLHGADLLPLQANALSFCAGVTNSYIWNHKFVFTNTRGASFKQFLKFACVACGGLAISSSFIYLTSPVLIPELAKFFAIFLTFGWGFLASRKFVFGA